MIIYFEKLQEDFILRSKELANKKLYIQNELSQIENLLNHKDFIVKSGNFFSPPLNKYKPKIEILKKLFSNVTYGWETFSTAYHDYFYNEEEKEFAPFKKGSDDTQKELDRFNQRHKEYHVQGIEFSKYTLWLKRHENKNVLSKPNTRKLTNKQKLLALHYLGLNLSKYDNTKTAKILHQILEIGETNVRTNLSYVSTGIKNEVRTETNLTKVSQLFESAGIIEVSSKIDKDIESLK